MNKYMLVDWEQDGLATYFDELESVAKFLGISIYQVELLLSAGNESQGCTIDEIVRLTDE